MPKKVFNKIFFDYDSTLINCESLDILAEMKGVGLQVRELTEASMEGRIPLERVFRRKVNLLAPSRLEIKSIGKRCIDFIAEGAIEVISILKALGKEVFILSSGFREIIDPSASLLGIPQRNIIANEFRFSQNGAYKGIDDTCVPSRSDGKVHALNKLLAPGDCSMHVGDGATDLACKNVVSLFIGYGGVAVRPIVREKADIYISDRSLVAILPFVLHPSELENDCLENFKGLNEKGFSIGTTTTTTDNPP